MNRAGRKREEITLIAVTKKFPSEAVREGYDLGLRVFGENYVQEFERKHPALTDLTGAEFHLIGHLQSNKSRIAGDLFQVIETVDSEKLARRLDQLDKPIEVMIEVKLSPEGTKAGAAPEVRIIVLAGWTLDLEGTPEAQMVNLVLAKPIRTATLVEALAASEPR